MAQGNDNHLQCRANLVAAALLAETRALSADALAKGLEALAREPGLDLLQLLRDEGAIDEKTSAGISEKVRARLKSEDGPAPRDSLASFGGDLPATPSRDDAESAETGTLALDDGGTLPMPDQGEEDSPDSGISGGMGPGGLPASPGPLPGMVIQDPGKVTIEHPGRYTIKGEQGRGAIGRVLAAFDEHVGRDVALKELLADAGLISGSAGASPSGLSSRATARFLREARITGQLEHPGVVPVYELGRRADGSVYYTMRLVRGRTLEEVLKDDSDFNSRMKLLTHFLALCQAMAYAHDRGVIHRDLKPANIMVGQFGETVVLDWGLAKVREMEDEGAERIRAGLELLKSAEADRTVKGMPLGTPAYMSPEQAEGRIEDVDERSDVFSLGAILYRVLTGEMPFKGQNAFDVMGKVISEEPRPAREVEKRVPGELAAICAKCMDKDRSKRYAHAGEVAEDIARFQTGGVVGAFDYPVLLIVGRWLRRRWKYFGLAAMGIAALYLLAVFLVFAGAFHGGDPASLTDDTLDKFSLVKETGRVTELAGPARGECNAAVLLMEATDRSMCAEGECVSRLDYDWFGTLSRSSLGESDPDKLEQLYSWSEAPEVDTFLSAADCANYQMWGVEVFPKPGVHWADLPIPFYIDHSRLAWLALARGMSLEDQGRYDEAREIYLKTLRSGHQLERDITIAATIGINIKQAAAERLGFLAEKSGDQEGAEAWRDYWLIQKDRMDAIRGLQGTIVKYSEEDMKKVIDDPDLMPGIRTDFYWTLLMRMSYSSPRGFLLGPSEEDRAYLFGDRFDSPEMKIIQLAGASEVTSGFFRRMKTGLRVIRLYRGLNAGLK